MNHTDQCIQDLASAFAKGACPRDLCIESLQSLVRLAISEYETSPMVAAAADLRRIEAIRLASKQATQ